MKKLALLGMLLGTAASAFAQGYFNFNNDGAFTGSANALLPTIGASGKSGQGAVGAVLGSGSSPSYDVSFLWLNNTTFSGPMSPDAFIANGALLGTVKTTFLAATGDAADGAGIFDGGQAILSSPATVDGQNITVQIIAWFDPTGNTTFAGAEAAGSNVGGSILQTVRLAAGLDSTVGNLSAAPGFSVQPVPEPTTFALAGIGAAVLMVFRRRK